MMTDLVDDGRRSHRWGIRMGGWSQEGLWRAGCVLGAVLVIGLSGMRLGSPDVALARPAGQGQRVAGLELVAQHGAGVSALAADGRYVYGAVGSRLVVLDPTFGNRAEPIAVLEAGGTLRDVAATGDGRVLALATDELPFGAALLVIDVSDPGQPRLVDRWRPSFREPVGPDARLVGAPGRAWIASADVVREIALDGPSGPVRRARRSVSASNAPLDWLAFERVGDHLVGMTRQASELRLVSLDAGGDEPLVERDARTFTGATARVAIGEGRIAVIGEGRSRIFLYRVEEEGRLAPEHILDRTWLQVGLDGRGEDLSAALVGGHLWLEDGRRLALVALWEGEPVHRGVTDWIAMPRARRPDTAPGRQQVGHSEGGLIVAEGRHGLRRAVVGSAGSPRPAAQTDLGLDSPTFRMVVADHGGAWAVSSASRNDPGDLWRVRPGARPRFVRNVSTTVDVGFASAGSRRYLFQGYDLALLDDSGADEAPTVTDLALTGLGGVRIRGLVGGRAEDVLLASIDRGGWERWSLDGPGAIRRRPLPDLVATGAPDPVLAGGVTWSVRRDGEGRLVLVGEAEIHGRRVTHWPGRRLTQMPLLLVGGGDLLAMVHLVGGSAVVTLFGWDEARQPTGLGEHIVRGATVPLLGAGGTSLALDGDRAWLAHLTGTSVTCVVIDISVPHVLRVVGRLRVPSAVDPFGAIHLGASGDRAWVTGMEDGVLYEMALRRAPEGPTRPAPPAPPAPSATPSPTAMPEPSVTPTIQPRPSRLWLPWLVRGAANG